MTANSNLDALGNAVASLGVTSGGFIYNATTGQLSYTSTDCNIEGSQADALIAAFNGLAGTVSPSTLMDPLGNAIAATSAAFPYSSPHLLPLVGGYPADPNAAQKSAIVSAFNALSTAVLAAAPPPAPSPAASSPALLRGILVGGESIMANCGGAAVADDPVPYVIRRPSQQWSINPQTGEMASMSVPMAGVYSTGDCFIPQMADLLLGAGSPKNLLIGNIAIGGTKFSDFAVGGTYNYLIPQMLGYFKAQRVTTSAVIWGQGINDNEQGSSETVVQENVQSVIDTFRANGYVGPIVFAVESIFNNGPVYANTVAGLEAAIALSPNCFIGPNLDVLLTAADKYDGTHPNAAGEIIAAVAWAASVAPYLT